MRSIRQRIDKILDRPRNQSLAPIPIVQIGETKLSNQNLFFNSDAPIEDCLKTPSLNSSEKITTNGRIL